MAQGGPGGQEYRCSHHGHGQQSRDELHQMTPGKRFRAQHHYRQAADGWHQRAELAEDDEGEPGEQDRC